MKFSFLLFVSAFLLSCVQPESPRLHSSNIGMEKIVIKFTKDIRINMKSSELEAVLRDSPYVAKFRSEPPPESRLLVGSGLTLLGPGGGRNKDRVIELTNGGTISLETKFNTQNQRLRRYGFLFREGDSYFKCLNGKISLFENMDLVSALEPRGSSASRPD